MRTLFITILFLINFFDTYATHLRGGEIKVEQQCGSLTVGITIQVYLDSESPVQFGQGELHFGDGRSIVIPELLSTPRPDLGKNVSVASYSLTHTFGSAGTYLISYTESNRNANVKNIPNSIRTKFHIETEIIIDPSIGCNNSPVLLVPPIDRACGGVTFFHNPGAYDPDGDSLSYEIVVPKSDRGEIINNYSFPDEASLYHENYNTANEDGDAPPDFDINPITGLLTWNAPPVPEGPLMEGEGDEYNIAFIVREWRKLYGQWVLLGSVRRDMQIIVEDCENQKPELVLPDDLCVEAGTIIHEPAFGMDTDKDSVKIEVFSQTLLFPESPATFEPDGDEFQLLADNIQGITRFHWETKCSHVRDQSYQVVFKITDKPENGPRLVNFATWNIKVIGPAPEITEVVNEEGKVKVGWEPYACENAELIEVWRRVDSNPYDPDDCETGMREGSGYQKIAEVPVGNNSYHDQSLAPGAKYCYRLVAVYPDYINTKSIVSEEFCFEYVPADAPVITHVSIERTDTQNGEVRVSWKKPFNLDPEEFPGEHYYDVYRGQGFSGADNYNFVTTLVNDTTYLDQGLNTLEHPYHYFIVLRIPDSGFGDMALDTSAVASTVRIEPRPEFGQIELDWQAEVPWSNAIADGEGAYHYIYRGSDGAQTLDDLALIDSVKVINDGFTYIDRGQFEDKPLDNNKFYCYSVMTRGTYGNPQIEAPLDNFSQITCLQPFDTIPPCKPSITSTGIDCENYVNEFGCNFNDFKNEVSWVTGSSDCPDDIQSFELFYSRTTTDEFQKIAETQNLSYVDTPEKNPLLTSFKGCYKVRAIDRSGNVSEFSDTYCIDNCPNYELPNVFTPLNGDNCNNQFQAFHSSLYDDEGDCGNIDEARCRRFVKAVTFEVYNRWGKVVYTYNSHAYINDLRNAGYSEVTEEQMDNALNINWDGRADNGKMLPPGIYYYLTAVEFDTVDPEQAQKNIKGWVHIFH